LATSWTTFDQTIGELNVKHSNDRRIKTDWASVEGVKSLSSDAFRQRSQSQGSLQSNGTSNSLRGGDNHLRQLSTQATSASEALAKRIEAASIHSKTPKRGLSMVSEDDDSDTWSREVPFEPNVSVIDDEDDDEQMCQLDISI